MEKTRQKITATKITVATEVTDLRGQLIPSPCKTEARPAFTAFHPNGHPGT